MSYNVGGNFYQPGAQQGLYQKVIGSSTSSTTGVLAAVTDTGTAQTITTGILALDRARRITATAGGTAADIKAVTVTVVGTDPTGTARTEVLPAFTVNTAGTVTGKATFKKITSITLPAHDGTGATTSVGYAGAPGVADTAGCHAEVTDTGTAQTITTAINQPEVPRAVSATAGGTSADIKAVSVVVTGTNAEDAVISETLGAFTVNTPGTKNGTKAFKTVTSIAIPAHDGTGATTAIGYLDVLGIGSRLKRNTVNRVYKNNTLEGTAATVVTSAGVLEANTIDLSNALASQAVVVEYMETPEE